jgi:hypothetical protein
MGGGNNETIRAWVVSLCYCKKQRDEAITQRVKTEFLIKKIFSKKFSFYAYFS